MSIANCATPSLSRMGVVLNSIVRSVPAVVVKVARCRRIDAPSSERCRSSGTNGSSPTRHS